MRKISGKCIHGGYAVGKILVYNKKEWNIDRKQNKKVAEEKKRFASACKEAGKQLHNLYLSGKEKLGQENAYIFEMQRYIILDEIFINDVNSIIESEKCNAEYAVATASKKYAEELARQTDAVIKERANDIVDVTDRILMCMSGKRNDILKPDEPVIILAENLTPSETISLRKGNVLGVVLVHGSEYSHVAILAKSMDIPCLIQTKIKNIDEYRGKLGAVEGLKGQFIINPTELECMKINKEFMEYSKKKKKLNNLIGKENITRKGKKIEILANIERPEDVNEAIENDAGGIGLFRSEFLFLSNKKLPSEEEQIAAYQFVINKMRDKKVIIRTIDIGADKQAESIKIPEEENPALGMRAIRLCLKETEIFKTQLRAILRASHHHTVGILIPMVTSLEEVFVVKKLLEQIREELKQKEIAFGDVKLGVMIETPAAVMMSDLLSNEVDFFSIGTNDLTQYTLAVDRNNAAVKQYYDPHHEAVFRMIEMTCNNAHKNGIKVCICGELAADLSITKRLLDLQIDELSVPSKNILLVRENVREMD